MVASCAAVFVQRRRLSIDTDYNCGGSGLNPGHEAVVSDVGRGEGR